MNNKCGFFNAMCHVAITVLEWLHLVLPCLTYFSAVTVLVIGSFSTGSKTYLRNRVITSDMAKYLCGVAS